MLEGRIAGMMGGLGFEIQSKTSLDVMTEDVIRSNEIEGILLNADKVRSSVARHLGLPTEGLPEPDHYTEGVVQVMIDAVRNSAVPLSEERLFNWHAALFPTGRSGMIPITVACWRVGEEPMQVVSGAHGKEKVHYEAPPSSAVPEEMKRFIGWFNTEERTDPVLKAAIAHLWFVAIHPFDDGNGRLTRTLTDMLLARADGMPHRFYSMSAEILLNRNEYYTVLENTTTKDVDITLWLEWFLRTLRDAMKRSEEVVKRVVAKALFWQEHREVAMNERQVKVVNKLWDGFEGKLTTAKWAKICKTSQPTAPLGRRQQKYQLPSGVRKLKSLFVITFPPYPLCPARPGIPPCHSERSEGSLPHSRRHRCQRSLLSSTRICFNRTSNIKRKASIQRACAFITGLLNYSRSKATYLLRWIGRH